MEWGFGEKAKKIEELFNIRTYNIITTTNSDISAL